MTKTKYLVGAFMATALLMGGCFSDDKQETPVSNATTEKLAGQRLTDDNGVEYTLIDNGDGTETARYDDGRSVTFRRQEDGSLDFLSGTAGLIAGMAAGYFLFHGFNSGGGTWDASRNRYTVNEPLQRRNTNTTAGAPSASSNAQKSSTATNSNTNSNSKVNLSKDSASSSSTNSSAKSGFGSAGARSSGTSAAS